MSTLRTTLNLQPAVVSKNTSIEQFNSQLMEEFDEDRIEEFQSQPLIDPNESFSTAKDKSTPAANAKYGKRKGTSSREEQTTSKKPKFPNTESLKDQITAIDPTKSLAIYDFLDSINEDLLVQEYVEKFLGLKILPIEPSKEIIDNWIKRANTETVDLNYFKEAFTYFFSYFQLRYYLSNVSAACDTKKYLINPKIDLRIPQFNLLPSQTLLKFTNVKEACALHYQRYSLIGAKFSSQLILLRICDLIMKNVKENTTAAKEQLAFESIFALLYTKSKYEFIKEYRPKIIDWEQKESKVTHTLPAWRKIGADPPSLPFNKYAEASLHSLNDNMEIAANTVDSEFKNFLQNGLPGPPTTKHSSNNFHKRRSFKKFNKRPKRPNLHLRPTSAFNKLPPSSISEISTPGRVASLF